MVDKKKKTGASRLGVPPVARKAAPAAQGPAQLAALWSNFGKSLEDLPGLASEIIRLSAERKTLSDEIEMLNIAVKGLMEGVDKTKSWSCRDIDADWVAIYIKPNPGKKIIPELLIQQGVTLKQIQKATKEQPKKSYVQVRTRNEKFEKEEE